MSLNLYLAYLAACIVLVIVPGPTVTVIVANSLRHGARAGLLNVAGTQLGLAVMIGIVILGLASLLEAIGWWFEVLRLAGAAYLVWLGIKLFRSDAAFSAESNTTTPKGGFFLQGFVVLMSNPKIIVLFGALFPQFIDPKGDYLAQVLLLGGTAMVTAAIFDTIYAVTAGRAGTLLSQSRTRLLSRISGGFLIGGGIWLALTRAR
jgi:threonine/homoserine/homoserine lactone efflux protein